jgi:hypothetical protein
MQPMLSGALLVAGFAAVAGLALVVVFRLYRISQPDRAARPRGTGHADQPDQPPGGPAGA